MQPRDAATQKENQITKRIIGFAIVVRRALGPGSFESARKQLEVVENLSATYEAQLSAYVKLAGKRAALLGDFNVRTPKQGLERIVSRCPDSPPSPGLCGEISNAPALP